MNAKNKKLLSIVGVAAVLLIVIGVSVSMLGKGDQSTGTDPAAAPTDVTTEDVSQPPEEETTTPTVEVPDVSAPENTPAQEQADPVLDVEQEDQVDVDLTDREKKPETTPPPAPSPEEQQAASENNEPIVSDPAANQPQNGDTQNGSIYIEGFGWIPDEGGSSVGIPVGNDGDELTGKWVKPDGSQSRTATGLLFCYENLPPEGRNDPARPEGRLKDSISCWFRRNRAGHQVPSPVLSGVSGNHVFFCPY